MIVELFVASGGLAEGFRRAGLAVDLAVERDPEACDSYATNLGARPWQTDVRALLDWTPPEQIDLLIADPPCAMWSRAGKRQGLADERDGLAITVEIIRRLRPRAYLVGNIPGLDDRPHWPVVQRLLGGLAADGYCVRDFASLDAADYGVPQRRVRPFWYGHLDGACLRWPERCSRPDAPAATVVTHPTAKGGQILSQNHAAAELDAPGRAILARNRCVGGQVVALDKLPDRRGETLTLHDVPQSARLAVVDRPSPTIDARPARAGTGNATLAWTTGEANALVLSERAALVLQGFPPGWTICGRTAKARWAQIGQAVPPAVAEAIARAMRYAREGA